MNDKDETMIPEAVIMSKIYMIRGRKVMLDKDLAELYEVKAIRLREQVKRNLQRFPESFMFRLTEEETDFMVSQNAIPSRQHLGGHLPYAFTEHGVLMLANVLKSERAMLMSIGIIEVFVKIREMMLTYKDILLRLDRMELSLSGHDDKILLIFEYLNQLEQLKHQELEQKERKRIGFKRDGGAHGS